MSEREPGHMSNEEFNRTWDMLRAKLTASEREVLDTVIAGAEVNHGVVYMLVAAGLGVIAGWCCCAMWG